MIFEFKPYPAYKPSGLEWLGDVPEHWEVRKIKDWLLVNCFNLSDDTHPDYTFDYLDIGSVGTGQLVSNPRRITFRQSPSRARRIVHERDTIVSTVRTYLKAVWYVCGIEHYLVASTGFAVLTPVPSAHPKFVNYACQSDAFTDQVTANSIGIVYPAISEAKFAALKVTVPPLQEQTSIARFLDHATNKIEHQILEKQKLITLLEEYKQVIIHQAVTGQIDVRTDQPYPAYKPSSVEWLGDVPEHWEIMRLKSVVHQVLELTGKLQEGIPYVALENVESWTGRVTPNCTKTTESQLKLFEEGDVLFGKLRPYLAKVMRAKSRGQCVGEFLVLRTTDRISQHFLDHLLRSKSVIDWINSSTFGAKMPRTDWHFVGNTRLAVPSLQEQTTIADFLDHQTELIDQLIEKKQKLIMFLEESKRAIIYQAITGKIDVREVVEVLQKKNSATCGDESNSDLI